MLPDLWILTVAPGSRLDEVRDLFDSTDPACRARRVVVTTEPDPIAPASLLDAKVLLFDSEELNIGKWWTVGLDYIATRTSGQPFDVFLVESDTRITPADLEAVRVEMRRSSCVAAGADWQGLLGPGVNLVRRSNTPVMPPQLRLPGIGLVVAGEVGLRHDPAFRWWYADDDFEWQSREAGGTVLVGGTTLAHTGSTPMEGDRARFAVEDVERFRVKWGGDPSTGGRVRE